MITWQRFKLYLWESWESVKGRFEKRIKALTEALKKLWKRRREKSADEPTIGKSDDVVEADWEFVEESSDKGPARTIPTHVRVGLVMLAVFLLSALGLSLFENTVLGQTWNWGAFVFYLTILWLFLSLRIVRENQTGAILFFRKPITKAQSGIHFVPFLLYALETIQKTVIQFEIPAEPELVWKGDDDKLPKGMAPPVRITHAQLESAMFYRDDLEDEPTKHFSEFSPEEQAVLRSDTLHRKRLVSEASGIVRLLVRDYCKFLGTIESMEGKEGAKKQIADTVVSTWQDVIAKLTPAEANMHKRRISKLVLKRVRQKCGEEAYEGESESERKEREWGIHVEDTELKPFDWRTTVNKAIAAASAAGMNKETTITDAEAEGEATVLIGRGVAESAFLLSQAKAKGVKVVADQIHDNPAGEIAARLLAMEEIAKKSPLTIVPTEGIFGPALGIAEAIKKGGPGSSRDTPESSTASPPTP